jgi:hypothetical protein
MMTAFATHFNKRRKQKKSTLQRKVDFCLE